MSDEFRPTSRKRIQELLARFDRPGPRYTSYPTAVEFDASVTEEMYRQRLNDANDRLEEPLSVYMHLPFCQNRCLFCGCHVIITPLMDRALPYLGMVEQEIDLVASHLRSRRRIAQLHLGGGTPTYFAPEALGRLVGRLLDRFELSDGAEAAVEVDPRVTTREHIDVLAEHGFNRVSLGVQDFTPEVQQAIDRVQSVEQTAALVQHARTRGFRGINIDLIHGLPRQTPESFERTVEAVIEMGADRSAVYSFAFVPWIRANMKKLSEADLPDRETRSALFGIARERFLNAGYEPIGMDHFARPDDELSIARGEGRLRRNFQGYSVIPATDVIGLGISAIGDVRGAYVQNMKKLSDYQQALAEGRLPVERGVLRSADDEVRRDVIHRLMCNFRVPVAEIEADHGVTFSEYFETDLARLAELEADGLVTIDPDRIEATPTGELFVRNLALCFDRYFREKHEKGDRPVFSRTV